MLALSALGLLASCTPEPKPSGVTPREFSDCDPISSDYCGFPFPSSFYEREDSTTPTGYRVHLGETTIPFTDQGEISYQPAPDKWNELDGFSPMGPMIAQLPGMADKNLIGWNNIEASIADGSTTVIIDVDTGERMPHFAELDYAGNAVEGQRPLFIRPMVPLRNGHHYVVALRGAVDAAGAPVAASEGFAALRDGTETDNWDIEGRRDLYETIFTTLEADGWTRAETQVAWDFHVKSVEAVAAKGEWMRDDARARFATTGPNYVVTNVQDDYNENIYRVVEGTMTVPLYTEHDDSGTLLTRGDDGMPYYNGETTVPFTIMIPRTAFENPRPLPLLQYGHGLLGAQDEVYAGYLGEVANRYGYVMFAADWTGMKETDSDAITFMILGDLSNFSMISEREQQGFVEFDWAAWMMKGAMSTDDAVTFDGVSVVDPNTLYYYGNSQGAILGGAYVALSQDITRATLGVGGAPYSILLSRSADFTPFFSIFQSVYDDERDLALWMGLLQQTWDPGEVGGYGRQLTEAPLDGTPNKQYLLQDALGDAQVTTLGAQNIARALGASLPRDPVQPVYGLTTQADGFVGSALAEFDFAAPAMPVTNTPPDEEFDTHESTRRAWAAQEQMAHFFATGEITSFCDGACMCAEGACDAPEGD